MLKKIKEWLEPKKKTKIGRPKLANRNVLKAAKIELAMAFVLIGITALSGTSVLTGKSPIELLSFGTASKVSGNFIIDAGGVNSVSSYKLNTNSTNGDIKLFVPDAERFFSLRIYYKKTDSSTSWTLAETRDYYYPEEAIVDAFWHLNKLKFIFRKLADYGPVTANKYRIMIRTLNSDGSFNKTLTNKNCTSEWTRSNFYCYKDVTIKKQTVLSKIRESNIVTLSEKTSGTVDLIISPTNTTKYMTIRKYVYNLRRKSWIKLADPNYPDVESLSLAAINSDTYDKGIDIGFYTTKTTKYRINVRLESKAGITDKNATMAACPSGWYKSSDRVWCYKYYTVGPKN